MSLRHILSLALCIGVAAPALAQNAGSYLAGRAAALSNDYAEAADYYTRALIRDQGNPVIIESALNSFVGLGDIDRAYPLARRLQEGGIDSMLANLVVYGRYARDGEWDAIFEGFEAGREVGPLFDGLAQAWAH